MITHCRGGVAGRRAGDLLGFAEGRGVAGDGGTRDGGHGQDGTGLGG